MWERHTQKAGELWITDLLQSVKRCRSTARPTEPAALLQSVGSRSRPVNISANQKWSFYDTLVTHPTLWNLTWWLFAYENIFMNDISYADHFSQHDIPAKSLCGRRDNVTRSGKHQHAIAVVAGKGGQCSWLSTCCAVIYAPVLCCYLPHDSCCCKPWQSERICISLILGLNWKKAAMLGKLCRKYQHIIAAAW